MSQIFHESRARAYPNGNVVIEGNREIKDGKKLYAVIVLSEATLEKLEAFFMLLHRFPFLHKSKGHAMWHVENPDYPVSSLRCETCAYISVKGE